MQLKINNRMLKKITRHYKTLHYKDKSFLLKSNTIFGF